jgi:flagellar assembly protein FliH
MSVEVRVHPDDFVRATEAHPRWKSAKFGEWEVVIVPDIGVSPGGCEVRSGHGRVDATLETKLELLESVLAEVMERSVSVHVNDLDSRHG